MGFGDLRVVGGASRERGEEERRGGRVVRGSAVHSASPDEEKRPWRGNREKSVFE